jgi:hypothetical protein
MLAMLALLQSHAGAPTLWHASQRKCPIRRASAYRFGEGVSYTLV